MISYFFRRMAFSQLGLPILIICLMPLFLFAAHKAKEGDGPAAQLSKAPRESRLMTNPFEGQAEAIAAGRKLYAQHCAECHGADGHGLDRAADLHSAAIQSAPPGALFWALRNGRIRKGMPSWSQLPDEQIWQLVTFVKTLK